MAVVLDICMADVFLPVDNRASCTIYIRTYTLPVEAGTGAEEVIISMVS